MPKPYCDLLSATVRRGDLADCRVSLSPVSTLDVYHRNLLLQIIDICVRFMPAHKTGCVESK